jgi:hypothetical protein
MGTGAISHRARDLKKLTAKRRKKRKSRRFAFKKRRFEKESAGLPAAGQSGSSFLSPLRLFAAKKF